MYIITVHGSSSHFPVLIEDTVKQRKYMYSVTLQIYNY